MSGIETQDNMRSKSDATTQQQKPLERNDFFFPDTGYSPSKSRGSNPKDTPFLPEPASKT